MVCWLVRRRLRTKEAAARERAIVGFGGNFFEEIIELDINNSKSKISCDAANIKDTLALFGSPQFYL